jgi:hypothetical protein
MFHQANMRVNDVPTTTVNGKTGQFSLLMTWIEVISAEMMRLYVDFASVTKLSTNAVQYHLASQDPQARRHRSAIHQPTNSRSLSP